MHVHVSVNYAFLFSSYFLFGLPFGFQIAHCTSIKWLAFNFLSPLNTHVNHCIPVDFSCNYRRSTISPGEQQRLALARLCYQQPLLAILDEATSQLSESDERQAFFSLLQRGISLVSIGHRTSLRQYHTRELQLVAESTAGWRLGEIASAGDV